MLSYLHQNSPKWQDCSLESLLRVDLNLLAAIPARCETLAPLDVLGHAKLSYLYSKNLT